MGVTVVAAAGCNFIRNEKIGAFTLQPADQVRPPVTMT
jgi:hypothetical protein